MYQIKEGKRIVPTCPECGCRLGKFEDMWYHFSKDTLKSRDARGCKCTLYQRAIEVIDPKGYFNKGNIVVI